MDYNSVIVTCGIYPKFMKKILLILSLAVPIIGAAQSASKKFGFIPNHGQIVDQYGNYNNDALYVLPVSSGMNLVLRHSGFSYDTYHPIERDRILFQRIDCDWLDFNPEVEIRASLPETDYLNYYTTGLGGNSGFGIQHFTTVTYHDIYEGVDLIFYADGGSGKPKFDLKIAPGTDMSKIKLKYAGYSSFKNETGLSFGLLKGDLKESIPSSWLEGSHKPIDVRYEILQEQDDFVVVGFGIVDPDEKDPDVGIVVDPEPALSWGTYYGDTLADTGTDVMTDNWGFIYMTGQTQSFTHLATSGVHQDTLGGMTDAYVVKFDDHGTRIWSTYFGGTGTEMPNAIMVDTSFYVTITGWTDSPDGIASDSAYKDTLYPGTIDAFIAKFDTDGLRYWSTYFGGEGEDIGTGVDTDFDGNVFITGTTAGSASGISSLGAHQINSGGDMDAFVVRLDTLGYPLWSTYFGGTATDSSTAIAQSGNYLLISGTTTSDNAIADPGAHQEIKGAGRDAFITAFNLSGTKIWGTYYGGSGDDFGFDVDVFNQMIFATGMSANDSVLATAGAFKSIPESVDAFLVRFDSLGNRIWGTYFGGENIDSGLELGVELDSNVFLFGNTWSVSGLAFSDVHDTTYNGGCDAYLSKFSYTIGMPEFASYYGGSGDDILFGGDVYGNTSIYICGNTGSLDSISYGNAYQDTLSGAPTDAFLARFITKKNTGANCVGGSCGGNSTAEFCEGEIILLTTNGGSLGTDANWVWYIDDCGGPLSTQIGIGDTVYYTVPPGLTTIYVRAESINNSSDCVTVDILACPTPTAGITGDTLVCEGGYILLNGSGNGSYEWIDPQGGTYSDSVLLIDSVTTQNSGLYQLIVTNSCNCSDTTDFYVGVLDKPLASLSITDVTCLNGNDGSVEVFPSGTGPFTYHWIPGGQTDSLISNLQAGVYILQLTDSSGCVLTDTAVVSSPPSMISSITVTPAHCGQSDGSATVNYSGAGIQVLWTPGGDTTNSVTGLSAGQAVVTLTNLTGCSESDTIDIPQIGGPQIDSVVVIHETCRNANDGEATVYADGGVLPYTYYWNPGGQTTQQVSGLAPGNHEVTVYDSSGCSSSAIIKVDPADSIMVSLLNHGDEHCDQMDGFIEVLALGGAGYLSYSWSNGDTTSFLDSLSSETYILTVTDENGCSFIFNYFIDHLPAPQAAIIASYTTIMTGDETTLEALVSPAGTYSYLWIPETDLSCNSCSVTIANPVDTIVYTLIVTDDFGCTDSVKILINVLPCGSFFVPDIFSPNNDQLNDEWQVLGTCISSVKASVFNRWGELIFYSSDPSESWDGTYKGLPVDAGSYAYMVEVVFNDGSRKEDSGNVKVIR